MTDDRILVAPRAETRYAKWTIHTPKQTINLYQTTPQLFEVAADVVPYLKEIDQVMGGAATVSAAGGGPAIKNAPGSGGESVKLPPDHPAVAGGLELDFADLFRAHWHYELMSEEKHRVIRYEFDVACYVWEVWHEPGKPTEVSFQMYHRNGTLEPMFDIARGDFKHLDEMLSMPSTVTSGLLKL